MAMVVCGATGSKEADEFGGLIKQYYAAWSTLDPDRAAPLYAKDVDLVFFDIAPLQYTHGWKEYRDNFKTNVAPTFSSLKITPNDDMKVIRKGDVALVTLTFHASIKPKRANRWSWRGGTHYFGSAAAANGSSCTSTSPSRFEKGMMDWWTREPPTI